MRARSFTAPSQLERNGSISSTRRRSSDSGCAGGGHDGRAAGAAAGPTCHGLMDNTIDALLIFEACRQGLVQKVSRRITEADPIVSGYIFVYDSITAGIRRWTDGRLWSPSKIQGNFLVYREIQSKICKSSTLATSPPPSSPSVLSSSFHLFKDQNGNKGASGSKGTWVFKKKGLVKQTISLTFDGLEHHAVNYFTKSDVRKKRIPLVRSLTLFQEIIISETILNSQSSYLRKRFDTPQQLSQAFKDQGGRLLSILDSSSGSSGGGSSDGEQVQDEDCDAFKTTAPTPHQAPASFLNQLDGPADDREDVWNNSNKDAEYHPPPPPPLSRKRSSTRDKRKQVVGSRRMKLNEDDVAETKDYSIQDINKEHEREAETKRHLDHVYELLCEIVDQENESPKEDVQLEAVIAPQSTMCSSLINDAVNTDGRFWELHVQSSDLGASHYDYHCSPQLPHESFLGGSNSDLLSGYENIEERRNMKTPFLNHCQDSANTATLPPLFLQSHTLKQQQDKLDISQAPPSVCRSRTDSGIGQVENKDDGTCLPSPSAHLSTRFDDLDFFFASSYPL